MINVFKFVMEIKMIETNDLILFTKKKIKADDNDVQCPLNYFQTHQLLICYSKRYFSEPGHMLEMCLCGLLMREFFWAHKTHV